MEAQRRANTELRGGLRAGESHRGLGASSSPESLRGRLDCRQAGPGPKRHSEHSPRRRCWGPDASSQGSPRPESPRPRLLTRCLKLPQKPLCGPLTGPEGRSGEFHVEPTSAPSPQQELETKEWGWAALRTLPAPSLCVSAIILHLNDSRVHPTSRHTGVCSARTMGAGEPQINRYPHRLWCSRLRSRANFSKLL